MVTFAEAHPEYATDFENNPDLMTFTKRDIEGNIVERWVRDENTGEMKDISEQELLKQEIEQQRLAIEKLKRREAYLKGRNKESDNS